MTSEEFESTSSSLGQGSSSTRSSNEDWKNEIRRESGHGVSMLRRRRRRTTVTFAKEGTPRCRARTVTKRAVFQTQSIDPEVDRAIVADAVHFIVSASSKGCVSLVSSFAEHLKYKISLEEKLISVTEELERLKAQPRCSVPITTVQALQTSQLTKQPTVKEKKVEKSDTDCELLLPGAVPHSSNTNNEQNYMKYPSTITTVSDFKDKGFGTENVTGSLPQISSKNASSSVQKICIDSETQTVGERLRKPVMIDRGCSPIPLVDSPNMSRINPVLLEQQFPKPPERVKIYCPTSKKKREWNTQKSSGDYRHLPAVTKSRPTSAISVTNHSAKSYPGVKYQHNKCPCLTCIQRKKRSAKMKK